MGSRNSKIWLFIAAALVPLLSVAWLFGGWLGARGADLWVLRLGLVVASTALAGGVGFWLQGRARKQPPAELGGDELDTTMATARTRLAASRAVKGTSLRELPMVLVLGPAGTAKTSTVAHCGLDPDLLAGDVYRGDQVVPTGWVNLWYSPKTVFLEVGAKVAGDAERWKRLLRYVRPDRLRALLPGRGQAPRVAVVCFSCEELLKPGGATAVPAAAQELRKVLVELAQAFGIRLPVYVMFTKADRIPFFPEFARNLSREEAHEVLGATLKWPPTTTPGLHAEREFQRVQQAFERLSQSLAQQRLPLLAREADVERRSGTYEFPREFRKLTPLATQFLVDLCRPSQLHVNPVLRGFYFTGVRAVVVRDAGGPVAARVGEAGRVGATQMFNPAAQPAAAPVVAGGRKVPEWLFVGRLFREVFLGDRVASVAALGSLRVHLTRRVALGSIAAFFSIWLLAQPISCFRNRSLASRTVGALRGLQVAASPEGELAGLEALRNLETVRAQLERLADYERDGAPLGLRFGLYHGSSLYAELGRTYLNNFERVLLRPTRESIRRAVRAMADSQGTQYGPAYELLRAYLMTTTRPDKIDSAFLTPVLMTQWLGRWQVDSARQSLARRQFEFYAAKLCATVSCEIDADDETIDRARTFLKPFTGSEGLYSQMLSKINAGSPPVRFLGAAALVDPYVVPGAFTPAGWDATTKYLKDEDNFQTEDWVLAQSVDPSGLRDALRRRYRADYVAQWRSFLEAAAVAPFGDRSSAARTLGELNAPQSPQLVRLLALVARNTNLDADGVGRLFQPVHILTPPAPKDSASELLKPYGDALIGLQALVDQAAKAGPAEAGPLTEKIGESARNAKTAVGQLATNFKGDGEAIRVGTAVSNLLKAPIDRVETLMRGLPGMALNSRGAQFCQVLDPLTSRFPFNPTGTDADLRDVVAVFQPQEGELWRFYNEALRDVLVRSGYQFTARPGTRVSPAFVAFFNRAAAISDALWRPGATEPQFDFAVMVLPSTDVPTVTLTVDGRPARWTQTQRRLQPFGWIGARAGQVTLSAQVRGREEELRNLPGTWALFRLFRGSTGWRAGADGSYLVQFNFPDRGVTLDAQLNLSGRAPILRADSFSNVRCVSRVIQ